MHLKVQAHVRRVTLKEKGTFSVIVFYQIKFQCYYSTLTFYLTSSIGQPPTGQRPSACKQGVIEIMAANIFCTYYVAVLNMLPLYHQSPQQCFVVGHFSLLGEIRKQRGWDPAARNVSTIIPAQIWLAKNPLLFPLCCVPLQKLFSSVVLQLAQKSHKQKHLFWASIAGDGPRVPCVQCGTDS